MKSLEQKKTEALQEFILFIQMFTHTVKPLVFFKGFMMFKEVEDVPAGCDECFGRAWYITTVNGKHLYYVQDKESLELYLMVYYRTGDDIKDTIMMPIMNLWECVKVDKDLIPLLDALMGLQPEVKKYISILKE